MDSWTSKQISAMEKSGGNDALVKFLASRGIEKKVQIATQYNTKQAAYFRDRLARWLDGKREPPPDPGCYDPVSGSEAQGAEPLLGETTEEYNARQARLREAARERLRKKFGNGGLGGVDSLGSSHSFGGASGEGRGGAIDMVGGVLSGLGGFLLNNVVQPSKEYMDGLSTDAFSIDLGNDLDIYALENGKRGGGGAGSCIPGSSAEEISGKGGNI